MLGKTQKELLKLLLKTKDGLTADELSAHLQITRNAVRQHLAALESDHLVAHGQTRPSGGRPQQLYVLTDQGKECFPRHYSWLAQLLIESIKQAAGPAALEEQLSKLGTAVAGDLLAQNPGVKTPRQKVDKLVEVMGQLGYNAAAAPTVGGEPAIEADNCIFHTLATANPEVCKFDLALMSTFTGSSIDHDKCMARGENICRFRFRAKPGAK